MRRRITLTSSAKEHENGKNYTSSQNNQKFSYFESRYSEGDSATRSNEKLKALSSTNHVTALTKNDNNANTDTSDTNAIQCNHRNSRTVAVGESTKTRAKYNIIGALGRQGNIDTYELSRCNTKATSS